MLDALRRPLPLSLLLSGVAGASLIVALYCVAYTSYFGRPESLAESLLWAMANVCPWLIAIEAGKRSPSAEHAAAVLAIALAGSLLLGYIFAISGGPIGLEALRRLPALAAAAGIVAALRSGLGRSDRGSGDIPLLPGQIDWVQAAGNYVELRAKGRTVVHRGSISAAERALADHGFIRIHRSTLVQRDRIARVRPHDVILTDGTNLRVGKRYRAALAH